MNCIKCNRPIKVDQTYDYGELGVRRRRSCAVCNIAYITYEAIVDSYEYVERNRGGKDNGTQSTTEE